MVHAAGAHQPGAGLSYRTSFRPLNEQLLKRSHAAATLAAMFASIEVLTLHEEARFPAAAGTRRQDQIKIRLPETLLLHLGALAPPSRLGPCSARPFRNGENTARQWNATQMQLLQSKGRLFQGCILFWECRQIQFKLTLISDFFHYVPLLVID